MKTLFIKGKYYFICLLCCLISACSSNDSNDEPEKPNENAATLVGEWIEDQSTEDNALYSYTQYDANGNYQQTAVLIDAKQRINTIDKYSGTYKVSKDELSISHNGNGRKESYTIQKLEKYEAQLYDNTYKTVAKTNRIVDTYNMSANETRQAKVNDSEFIASSYKSSNPRVATVDNDGIITAVKRGTAYIFITSSMGTAAIKVAVEDGNVIDDYTVLLNTSSKNVIEKLGKNYLSNQINEGTEYDFFMDDENVSIVSVLFQKDKATMVIAQLRDNVDFNSIRQSYEKKNYEYSFENNMHHYTFEKGGYTYDLICQENERYIGFQYALDEIAQYDNLINMSIEESIEAINYSGKLNDKADENGQATLVATVNSSFFQGVGIIYDVNSRKNDFMILFCQPNADIEKLASWYNQHYFCLDSDNLIYGNASTFDKCTVLVMVKYDQQRNAFTITYNKR